MNLYVGNLSDETTSDDLRKAFEAHGTVASVSLLTTQRKDGRHVGPSRGFGFVVMPDNDQARAAVAALHQVGVRGRSMTVQAARPAARFRR